MAPGLLPESYGWSYRRIPVGDLPGWNGGILFAGLCSIDVSRCGIPFSRYLVFPQDGEDLRGCDLKLVGSVGCNPQGTASDSSTSELRIWESLSDSLQANLLHVFRYYHLSRKPRQTLLLAP